MSDRAPIRRLLSFTKPYKPQIFKATTFSITNKLLDLAPPLLIGAAVDIVVRRENSIIGGLGFTNLRYQLYFLGLLTFLVWAGESVFEYMYKIQWRGLAQTVQHELRIEAYDHIQHLELEYFEDRQTGGLMAVLNDDINQLERFLDIGANDLIQVATTVIAIEIMFFLINPTIGLLAIIPIPLILLFSIKFQKRLEPRYALMRDKVGILNGRLSNNLTGISTIKSYTNQDFEKERITASSLEYKQSNEAAIALSSAFSPLIRMIIVGGFLAMMIVGGIYTLEGTLEVAAYSIIIFLIQRLLWPLTRLGETFDQYQRAMASTTRVLDLLDTKSKIIDGDTILGKIEGEIEFQNVSFAYKNRIHVLKDFSVKISKGESIAFVGTTGSGKTTLIKLILRLYDPTDGAVKIDGHDLRDLSLSSFREGIGLVSQDVFLIDGTVKENIVYGKQDATEEEIKIAAKIAEVSDFISTLPDKYDTMVGERGQKLSGGQRQRISIARAVLKDPPILIFDEATSSVDNETEAAIQRSLEKLTQNRTTILIAHRLSTIRNVDRIYVLENGKIVEQGNHDELVDQDGLYANLWKVQTGAKIAVKAK
ncbi:MAG: ABC transporter ATP-binding protein [Candidatus Heimdallarchaeota archaeon]|nr:ABC transporter ATP-binding protein [Candidatus Heimdallarchaeota archaeon]